MNLPGFAGAGRGCLAAVLAMHLALPVAAQERAAPESVNFNFEQADLRLVIRLVGEWTGKRFVVDDRVEGTVTVVTPPRIRADEVYPLFLSILESSGYTVVDQGAVQHVVPRPDRQVEGGPVVTEANAATAAGVITRIFEVEHISALELANALQPLVAGGDKGAVAAFGSTNHLLITDTAENLRRLEEIIRRLDREGASRVVDVIRLQHASADELAPQLTAVLAGTRSAGRSFSRRVRQVTGGGGDLPGETVVLPAAQANSLVLAGPPAVLSELKNVIRELDVELPMDAGRLHVIFLKYLAADEAAENLNALLEKSAATAEQPRDIAIEPNLANNALLVEASPRNYERVKTLVEEIDQIPHQVMVEVLIAEVTLGDDLDLGVELSTIDQPDADSTTFIGRSRPGSRDLISQLTTNAFFAQGITMALANGTFTGPGGQILPRIPVLIRAIAENRDVRILSNVPLWAQNNREASVSVVDNIPILKSTIQGGAGTARDVIQNIERMDVGIELTMTPHVNPDREVSLDLNPSIEAIVDQGPPGQFSPTIAKRDVSTTVTIPDRATVVLSGLIREDIVENISKVPLLGDIPFLGQLFRRTTRNKQKTHLLIFVTPHIVTDMAEADALRKSMQERTDLQSGLEHLQLRPEAPQEP